MPALEVVAEDLELSDDVAGATLMAAGGSAPELFTSMYGTFTHSAVGFGTIVGSAVFNVLFVIGACAVASPVPLKLTSWPLARDSSYYMFALSMVAVFFSVHTPQVINWWEAFVLFAMYFLYVYIMANNDDIQEYVPLLPSPCRAPARPPPAHTALAISFPPPQMGRGDGVPEIPQKSRRVL